jgi:ABC-2 type transport system permease protein
MQRQTRAHWMVIVSLALLAVTALLVHLNTVLERWNMAHWRAPRSPVTYGKIFDQMSLAGATPLPAPAAAVHFAVTQSFGAIVFDASGLVIFSRWIVFAMFATFLMPLWTLSFATEALGREREGQNLIWTLVRPIPRPAVYLAKYVAVLPWCLAFNLGGLYLLCRLGGEPGRLAFRLYWPAVLWGTLAFAALFHLLGACLRRAGVVALLYAFFLETIAGNMPGQFKRLSISFYTRCLMFEHAQDFGIGPERPWIYLPVSGTTAQLALGGATVALLAVGMLIFSRSEYLDVG